MSGTPIWPIEGVALESVEVAVPGSLAYRLLRMYDDSYMPVIVYPTLAAGVPLVSGNADWVLGAVTQIIPAGIATPFLLQMVVIETLDKDGVFELVLYHGAADAESARIRFSIFGGFFGQAVFRIPSALIPTGERIRAALACSTGLAAAANATISLAYRPVP